MVIEKGTVGYVGSEAPGLVEAYGYALEAKLEDVGEAGHGSDVTLIVPFDQQRHVPAGTSSKAGPPDPTDGPAQEMNRRRRARSVDPGDLVVLLGTR